MDLSLESDIYEPSICDDGNYVDYIPPSSKFAHGLRCPCGARKDHIFDTRTSFSTHIKSKTHQKWLVELNSNKMNYYTECEKLKELVNSQKIIIAKMESDLHIKMKTINYLSQQLMAKDVGKDDMIDLLSFD
jgi:hypothetical protein